VVWWQAEISLRTSQAKLKVNLGIATPQDTEDAKISHRLSGEGFFAADGDMTTKKRFSFTKSAALKK
jgi:hypothetical protein